MRIYLIVPAYKNVDRETKLLESKGYTAIRNNTAELASCDAVCLLGDWKHSAKCKNEKAYADATGLSVVEVEE